MLALLLLWLMLRSFALGLTAGRKRATYQPLAGETMLAFGDSISDLAGNLGVQWRNIANLLGLTILNANQIVNPSFEGHQLASCTASGGSWIQDPLVTFSTGVGVGGPGFLAAGTTLLTATGLADPTMLVNNAAGSSGSYTVAPTGFTITGGGGSGAVGTVNTASIGGGKFGVTGLHITTPGTGFVAKGTIAFTGGTIGAGDWAATADCNLVATTLASVVLSQTVLSVTVTGGGSYSVPPTGVTFTGGGGANASAMPVVVLSGGVYTVTAVIMQRKGSGYTSAPAVAFTGGTGTAATATANMTSQGFEYDTAPTPTFYGNVGTVGTGSGGTGTATLDNTTVLAVDWAVATATLAMDATHVYHGSWAGKMGIAAASTTGYISPGGDTGTLRNGMYPLQTYTFSTRIYVPAGTTGTITLYILDNDGSGYAWTTANANMSTTNAYQLVSVTRTIRANATEALCRVLWTTGAGTNQFIWVDGAQLEPNSAKTQDALSFGYRAGYQGTLLSSNDNTQFNGISTAANRVAPFTPQNIFMQYGMNDLGYITASGATPVTPATWRTNMQSILNTMQAYGWSPKIYVLGISKSVRNPTPVAAWNAIGCFTEDQVARAMNNITRQECASRGIVYIEMRDGMDSALLQMAGGIGVHPTYPVGAAYMSGTVMTAFETG